MRIKRWVAHGGRLFLKVGILLVLPVVWVLSSAEGSAQALAVDNLENGSQLVLVSEPLAEASAGCWPSGSDLSAIRCVVGSDLVFQSELERALAEGEAPPVVIIVGGPGRSARVELLRRLFHDRPPTPVAPAEAASFEEGSEERRLGNLGSPSTLRLEFPLPPPGDPQRPSVEVLWRLLPKLLRADHPGLRSAVEGDVAEIESSLDPERAEVTLRRLRLSLARLAADPALTTEDVEREARRLRIGRQASLEKVEPAARHLVDLWRRGGLTAVRRYLFGPDGVTLETVREAAHGWLPAHPGHAVLNLPPRVFRPRFAPGPTDARLDNDLAVAVLERPVANLSAMVVRPVLLSGLSGEVEAVILTRVAAALRSLDSRPPFIEVGTNPPRLELATSADDFASLTEALQEALDIVARDDSEVESGDDARSRALRLMAGVFGLDAKKIVSPAGVLAPENLAIGAVGPDAEAAIEALKKFGVGGLSGGAPQAAEAIDGGNRRRLPAAGTTAAVAAAVFFDEAFPLPEMVGRIIHERAEALLEGATIEILRPLVPGKKAMVVLVQREGTLEDLEASLEETWLKLFSVTTEEELERVRRDVAAAVITGVSGVMGRARACARVAAGEGLWREPAQAELTVLTTGLDRVNETLARILAIPERDWTSSGPLPPMAGGD